MISVQCDCSAHIVCFGARLQRIDTERIIGDIQSVHSNTNQTFARTRTHTNKYIHFRQANSEIDAV